MRSVYMELQGEFSELATRDRNARNRARRNAQLEIFQKDPVELVPYNQLVHGPSAFKPAEHGSRLFVYRIIHEVGFAPNLAGSVMTLATCKPAIRRSVRPGDYIAGILPKMFGFAPAFVAQITNKMTMGEYWSLPEWSFKKPNYDSWEGLYGDNVYEQTEEGFVQHPCNHSLPRWTANQDLKHLQKDTSGEFVLASTRFIFGGEDRPILVKDRDLLFSVLGVQENIRGHRIYPGSIGQELVEAIQRSVQ